jgi:hypothetical protein
MDATGRSRVTFASQIAEVGLKPMAAITNVGLVFAVRVRGWRPAPTLPTHSDPMLSRFDRHLWRTMPTDDG